MEESTQLDPKIIAALIASIVTTLIAVFNSIWQYRNYRKIAKESYGNSAKLEQLKAIISNKSEFQSQEIKNKFKALHDSSNAIQLLKDDLRKIRLSVDDSFDLSKMLIEINESAENLSKIYASNHMYLSQIDEDLKIRIHRAKNLSITIQSDFQLEIKAANKSKRLSPMFIKKIIDRTSELNEIDMRLIEKKAEMSYAHVTKFESQIK